MVSTLSSFQTQLVSIMETLVQTAVLEINKLVDMERDLLLSEVSRGRGEISALRRKLMELQPRTNSGQTHKFTHVKSECGREESHNHLNIYRDEVVFGESPSEIQQDQVSPQQNCEVNHLIGEVKQEPYEVDVWIGPGNSEVGNQAVRLSTTKEVLKIVPRFDRGSKENTTARVPSISESPELTRNALHGAMLLNQTSESENASFNHIQTLSASKSTRTYSANSISGDKRFVCTYCSKRFKCFSQLTIHQRSHTGEKPYRCTICGKRYIQKGHLYTHQRTHTGEKPYRCPLCGKGFIQKCTLDMHMRSHTGEKPYTCAKCGKGFTTKFNLNKHLSCQSCTKIS